MAYRLLFLCVYTKTNIDELLEKVLQDKTTNLQKNLNSSEETPVSPKIDLKDINEYEKFFVNKPFIEKPLKNDYSNKTSEDQNQRQKIDDLLNDVINAKKVLMIDIDKVSIVRKNTSEINS